MVSAPPRVLKRASDPVRIHPHMSPAEDSSVNDEQLAARLREALAKAVTARTIAAPATHSDLLQRIVETAAGVIAARAAALFLVDEATQELRFEVALGERADEVKEIRVPLGHGIAGGVALSGQPMAVSDAQQDERWATEIGERVGYTPDSIVCVPALLRGRGDRRARAARQGGRAVVRRRRHPDAEPVREPGCRRDRTVPRAAARDARRGHPPLGRHRRERRGRRGLDDDIRAFSAIEGDRAFVARCGSRELVREIGREGEQELARLPARSSRASPRTCGPAARRDQAARLVRQRSRTTASRASSGSPRSRS